MEPTLYGDTMLATHRPQGEPTGLVTGTWWTCVDDEGFMQKLRGKEPKYYLLQWESGASEVENGDPYDVRKNLIGTEWLQGYSYYDTREERDELFLKMKENYTTGNGIGKSINNCFAK